MSHYTKQPISETACQDNEIGGDQPNVRRHAATSEILKSGGKDAGKGKK
ncbi:MAG: hypothetical protein WBD22_14080 [Pyrinomonadaceae bacterium]